MSTGDVLTILPCNQLAYFVGVEEEEEEDILLVELVSRTEEDILLVEVVSRTEEEDILQLVGMLPLGNSDLVEGNLNK
jgi:hypothetical protein